MNFLLEIAYISLRTASPLLRWKKTPQIMLEKGKEKYIDDLRIIQLCEADLNVVLHTIWGHRLIRHATHHSALHPSQFALPGETCNNAVSNKVLFCDLSRQTLSRGSSLTLMPPLLLTAY